jgi:hypothetical protein
MSRGFAMIGFQQSAQALNADDLKRFHQVTAQIKEMQVLTLG